MNASSRENSSMNDGKYISIGRTSVLLARSYLRAAGRAAKRVSRVPHHVVGALLDRRPTRLRAVMAWAMVFALVVAPITPSDPFSGFGIDLGFHSGPAPAVAADIGRSSTSSAVYTTGSNWEGGVMPGMNDTAILGPNTSGTVAVWPSGNSLSINFGSGGSGNNYTTTFGSPAQIVGAFLLNLPTSGSAALSISATSGAGTLILQGNTVSSQSNVIISVNRTSGSRAGFTITNGSGANTMTLRLNSTTNVITSTGGSGTAFGPSITIGSSITQTNPNSSIKFLGGGLAGTNVGAKLVLDGGNNSFTGGITIGNTDGTQAGKLEIRATTGSAVNAISGVGTIVINNGSGIQMGYAADLVFGTSGQNLVLNGSGSTVSGYDGDHGVWRNSNAATWQGDITVTSSALIVPTQANGVTFSGNVYGGGTLKKGGSGSGDSTMFLTGSNTSATFSTELGSGFINVASGSKLGSGDLKLNYDSGYSPSTSTSVSGVTLNNAAQTIRNLSSTFTGNPANATQTLTLAGTTLTIQQTVDGTFGVGANANQQSVITGSGSIIVTSTNSSKLTFSGTNSYSGGTTITGGGTLLVTNTTSASALGSGAVAVNSTGTLGGTGTISGTVTMVSGGTINPGVGNTAGTLHLGSLVLNGGTLAFGLGALGTNDQIAATGVTVGGTTTFNLSNLGGLASGDYTLISYSTLSGFANLKLGNGTQTDTLGAFTITLQDTGSSVRLHVDNAVVAENRTWTGATNGVFTTASNWSPSGYNDGDSLTFSNTAGATTISIDSTVAPAALTFSATTSDYTLAGTGGIAGSTGIVKSGGAALTISTNNTFSGATQIQAGVVSVNAAGALGTTTNGTSVSSGAALQLFGGVTIAGEGLTLSGTGVSNGGALRNISGTNTYGGLVTLSTDSRINADSGSGLRLAGGVNAVDHALAIGGDGTTTLASTVSLGTGVLTKDGTGTLNVTSALGTTGGVVVSGGMLVLGDKSSAASNPTTFLNGADLTLNNGGLTIAASNNANSVLALNTLTVTGNSQVVIYRTGGNNSQSATLSSTTMKLAGSLTIDRAGNTTNQTTPRFAVGFTDVLTNSTLQLLRYTETISGTSVGSNLGLGVVTDNGNNLVFQGQGTSLSAAGNITIAIGSTMSGNWTIGNISGTEGVTVSVASMTTGNVTVNPYSQLQIVGDGVYGADGKTLTLNGSGPIGGNGGTFRTSGGTAIELLHDIVLVSDATINTAGATNVTTLSGDISGSGMVIKDAGGKLVLSGTGNTATGATQLNRGIIEVVSGSSLGTGNLTLALNQSGEDSGIIFNNTTQHIGNLSATSTGGGTGRLQSITLNGTTLNVHQSGVTNFGTHDSGTSRISGTGGLLLAADSTGTLIFTDLQDYTGGTTISGGTLALGVSDVFADGGAVTVNGGTLDIGANNDTIGAFNMSSGSVTGSGVLTVASYSQTGGTFSASLVTGTMNVTGGVVQTTGQTINADVNVSNGGTVAGTGTISGTVTVGTDGTLGPGNSPGLLTIGDLVMDAGNYHWELGSLTTSGPGTNFDFVLVDSGDADLSSLANVELDFSLLPTLEQPGPDDAFWLTDQQWTILQVTGGGSVNGTFNTLSELVDLGVYGSGLFSLAYDSNTVYLNYNFTAVPEPGSLLLAALGAIGMGGLGWRRRRRLPTPMQTSFEAS